MYWSELSRKFEVIITRHYQIFYSFVMAKHDDSICTTCGASYQGIKHIFTEHPPMNDKMVNFRNH